MRRLALLLAALVAFAGVAAAADARKKPRKARRGYVVSERVGLPGAALAWRLRERGGRLVARPPRAAPKPAPAPAPRPGGAAPPPPPPPPLPVGSGRSLQARTDDRVPARLKLTLSRSTVLAGEVKLEFNNAISEDPHDLQVERVDGTGASYSFDELGPGEVATRKLALDAGTWRLRCTIPTHAERGMSATLLVSG